MFLFKTTPQNHTTNLHNFAADTHIGKQIILPGMRFGWNSVKNLPSLDQTAFALAVVLSAHDYLAENVTVINKVYVVSSLSSQCCDGKGCVFILETFDTLQSLQLQAPKHFCEQKVKTQHI